MISSPAQPAEASGILKGIFAIFQAKRTKNTLKNRFLLSEKRVNMDTEITSDQTSTKSALTEPPTLNARVMIDAADRDLHSGSTLLWLLPRCAFCGRAANNGGAVKSLGWRGEADEKV